MKAKDGENGVFGFLILFHIANAEDRIWWNIGGWGNTRDAVENKAQIDSKPSHIESNRWYDIKVAVGGDRVKCYLDGQLVHDVNYESETKTAALYACASYDEQTGDEIVKVVNASFNPLDTELDLTGSQDLTGQGAAIVLTSLNPSGENSLEDTTNVAPKTETISFEGNHMTRSFPGNSFTVLRLKNKQR